jgi:hypothetical protein
MVAVHPLELWSFQEYLYFFADKDLKFLARLISNFGGKTKRAFLAVFTYRLGSFHYTLL